ncbi:hypothetical protein C0580_02125 [Candidatus Parcubacteria bacterium]|nr:MAG: hypothetical protein C0580_02125 [Candidatus Parcubacteria bacterium]
MQKFILAQKKPENMVLMIQKEVAERIVAKDNKNSLLSLSVAFYAKSKIETIVTKDNFYPVPKVDSAVINIFDIQKWPYKQEEKKTWQLIKRGFASKRKKLLNNLSTDPNLSKENIMDVFSKFGLDENIRAENLSPKDWLNLSQNL